MPNQIENGFLADQILGSGANLGGFSMGYPLANEIEADQTPTPWITTIVRTGHGSQDSRLDVALATGSKLVTVRYRATGATDELPLSISEKLNAIKAWLGLNISQLSAICRVERPTIYNWLAGATVRSRNQERVGQLYELALEWKRCSGLAVGDFLNHRFGNESLMELLSGETVYSPAVSDLFPRIRNLVDQNRNELQAGSIADRLKGLGFSEKSEREQGQSVVETGQSFSGPDD
ncbi:hypothetical protein N9985_02925 [Gammaproteobacteria bacterium]|nr:hypothetical protein [Gammaproteobacteria bacterium]